MKKEDKKKKIVVTIFTCIILICLLVWYAFAAYIQVNTRISSDYLQGTVTKYVAHRGLSSEYYQNTYDAFYYAEETTFFGGIECDIWRTLDGVWVCCHDDTPFEDKSIKVSERNFADIENLPLDTKNRGELVKDGQDIYITTYEQYLGIMRYSRKKAFVEIKFGYSQEIIEELIDFTSQKCKLSKVIFISFNKKVLELVATYTRQVKIMLLSNKEFASYLYAKMGYNLGLSKNVLNKRESRVELLHEHNSFAYVYTVNSLEEAKKFEEMEVDYIATDYDLNKKSNL